ncbi:hypothetical protein LTR97_010744 [Elasticomyces elasticus]|uniref:polynucleotide adenylyltransferase n=1 Tax=Elasticomyces elasticus TaxID=574655 RepID=A0AAN8A0A2_9PEZI|nr:hypothetical protein LTR97_010744 [Elasticomyces elasticus]
MGDYYRAQAGYGNERPRGNDYYGRDTYYDDRQRYEPARRDDGYNFRGAAERQPDRYAPRPQDQFSFRAEGPPAPRFPPHSENFPPPQRPQRRQHVHEPRHNSARPVDQARQRHAQSQRGRGGFRGRAAHNRVLLRTDRQTTPEQLEGMNHDGQTRFLDIESISSGSEAGEVIDLTIDSDDGGVELPRKRAKVEVATETAVPKWSNPDPYTVLPPPETLGAPKKDIVQTIRKAKTDAISRNGGSNAVQENIDFISFNFDNDQSDGEVSEASDPDLPQADAAAANTSKNTNGFSHRTDFHATIPSAQMQPSFTSINNGSARRPGAVFDESPPPQPPPGFVMPTDAELMAQYVNDGKGTKRKRNDGRSKSKGDIVDEWEANDTDPTPWCTIDHSQTSNVGLRLHKEICDFYDFVRPYDYEEAVRRALIDRIQRAIRTSAAPNANTASVYCFGSFAAGLYLPTADMDLVATSPQYMNGGRKQFLQTATQMWKLKAHFERSGIAPPEGVVVISKAKVPIVKFPDKLTGIKVDISFENDSGIVANDMFKKWKEQYPAMPVIVVLVKQLLAMRGLNEVYTGGIGGFTTICLVVSMMQMMPELQSGSVDPRMHYGEMLMNFLDLYGNKIDIRSTGIRMEPPGYFNKVHNPAPKQNLDRLTIIDPNNEMNDISGGSSEIDAVLDTFRHAHAAIQRRLGQVHSGHNIEDSILGCQWGGNYTSFMRQREKLSVLHRGYAVSPAPPPAPKLVTNRTIAQGKRPDKRQRQMTASQNSVQSTTAMRGSSSNGLTHSLPVRPSGQAHALPPRPSGSAYPLPPNPSAMNLNADATNDTDSSSDDEMHIQDLSQNKKTNSQKKREHQQKAAQKARDRAKNWNAAHPDLATHLTSLKPRDLRALCKQHGFKRNGDVASPKTAVASELPKSDVKQEKSKKKEAMARAERWKAAHPEIRAQFVSVTRANVTDMNRKHGFPDDDE